MSMRRTGIWVTGLLAFCPWIFAQQAAQRPAPALPAEILGPPLIAWSELQKPRPVPQPLPPPERADQSPPQQSANSPAEQQESPARTTAQTFTGTIVKDGGKYVLKASDGSAYQVDDQDKAKLYEGKQVKISGSLDGKNVLHIVSIEVLS